MSRPIQDPTLLRIVSTIRDEIDPDYEFVEPGPIPCTSPPASPREARVALVTTAGLHLKGDRPFRTTSDPLGDTGFRIVPAGATAAQLDLDAPYVDRRHIPLDPELALPLRALADLAAEGLCGPAAPRHASLSGGIVKPLPGLEASAAALAGIFAEDAVGAVVLLPSCPLCVQTVCLLARSLEARALPTVCLTLLPELSRIVGAPRTLAVRFPFGAPCGDPGRRSLHKAVVLEALRLLVEAEVPGAFRDSGLGWRREPPPLVPLPTRPVG
jgi:hypothetical protein